MRCLFGSRTSLDTTLAPIGFYCDNAGTHGIKPGISLSFDFNGHSILLRLLFWHGGPVWAFGGRTPEPVSPVQESAPVFHWPSAAFNSVRNIQTTDFRDRSIAVVL